MTAQQCKTDYVCFLNVRGANLIIQYTLKCDNNDDKYQGFKEIGDFRIYLV